MSRSKHLNKMDQNQSTGAPKDQRQKPTRATSVMTPSQLARKRANDREAQRAMRVRNKAHIQELERELAELKKNQPGSAAFQELLRRNQALEIELSRLRESTRLGYNASSSPSLGPQGSTYYDGGNIDPFNETAASGAHAYDGTSSISNTGASTSSLWSLSGSQTSISGNTQHYSSQAADVEMWASASTSAPIAANNVSPKHAAPFTPAATAARNHETSYVPDLTLPPSHSFSTFHQLEDDRQYGRAGSNIGLPQSANLVGTSDLDDGYPEDAFGVEDFSLQPTEANYTQQHNQSQRRNYRQRQQQQQQHTAGGVYPLYYLDQPVPDHIDSSQSGNTSQ